MRHYALQLPLDGFFDLGLAMLCLRVQDALGDGQAPQDIEWAFDGARFWLLQARPVTTAPEPALPGAGPLPTIWTRGNVKDAFPGVLTPLSWSLMQRFGRAAVLAPMALAGYPVPPGLESFHRFSGRVYLNLTNLAWLGYDANGTPPAELNRTVGANPPLLPVPAGDPLAGAAGKRRKRHLMRFLLALWRHSRGYGPKYRAARAAARQARQTALGALSNADLATRWADLAAARRQSKAAFEQALAEYLEEFGHRALYESDLANPRWREDPSYLLEQLEHPVTGRSRGQSAHAAALAEVRARTLLLRPLLHWLVKQNQQVAAQREAGRSTYAELAEPLRLLALEAGRRMTATGLLASETDVFYLSEGELLAWLRGGWDGRGAGALTRDRQAQLREWLGMEPPDHIVIHPSGQREHVAPPPPVIGADGVLTGLGVAAGQATGPVRVLLHPAEGAKLRPGDVLVAPSTDPGWTPLFLRASAVIMEVGGYLSHGAIVAREYGLPAVVNLHGATRLLQDGEPVVVDGDTGKVYRCSHQ